MITINLKPGAQAREGRVADGGQPGAALKGLGQKIKDPYRIGALILGTAWLGYVGMSHLTASAEIADLEPKLEQARAENQRFRAFLGEKRRLESVRDSIQAQIATIRDVDGDRYVWPQILDEVARAVPPYTWLTDVAWSNVAAPVGGRHHQAGRGAAGPGPGHRPHGRHPGLHPTAPATRRLALSRPE